MSDSSAGQTSRVHKTPDANVFWMGHDKYRAEALANTDDSLHVIEASIDGREALAVIRGTATRIEWDSHRPSGYRLIIE